MKFLFLLSTPLFIFGQVHYAKVEAYESVVLKSAVSALVLDVDLNAEGKMISDKRVIHLEDTLDRIDLEATQESVVLLKNMLGINKEIEQSVREITQRQEGYFSRISTLSTVSKTQKDNAYSSFASAKTQYLNTKEKTAYKVDKLWKTADEKFISSCRAEIYIPVPKESFSRLVKVEIK